MTELVGKTALVTGAAGGIGRAIAAALRVEGATVMGADVHPAEADHIIVGDLMDAQFCDRRVSSPARSGPWMAGA